MGRYRQTIELNTDLGIHYIPCCKIVLMFYNYWICEYYCKLTY